MRTLLLTLTTCLFVLPVQAKYSGGSGTAHDPYQIATAADLILLGETPDDYDKHFILTADIDLDPKLPGRKVFDKAVIAPDSWSNYFYGVFDGSGHTISHLTIKGERYLGLFGWLGVSAEIKNLGVVDVSIIGSLDRAGGLVGYNSGTVTNCYSTGVVKGYRSVGGLVGANSGTVTKCYSTGAVTGKDDSVGGLVGWNGGDLTHCYSTGAVSGGSDFVGGLVGSNSGTVSQCYSTSGVSGGSPVGGLVGDNSGTVTQCYGTGTVSASSKLVSSAGGLVGSNSGTVAECYSTGTVSTSSESGSLGGLVGANSGTVTKCYSTGAVTGKDSVGGLVGSSRGSVLNSIWDINTSALSVSDDGVGLTTTEMMDPYTLALNGFANDPNWGLNAGRDYPRLAWEGTGGQLIPAPKIEWLAGRGTPEEPHRIDTADQLILLGKASVLWDRHFVLGVDIDLDPRMAGRQVFGQAVIAALAGVFDGNGHIVSHVTIKGKGRLGLFGRLASGAQVKNLGVADASITGSGGYVGGLVGHNSDGTLTNCYSTGAVAGNVYVGGLVGHNSGTVTQCYSTSSVSGDHNVGGLVGDNGDGSITQCYSTGAVTGKYPVGGLVGSSQFGQFGHVWMSFWDIGTSGRPTSAGGTGKTTAQMQDIQTFLSAGWDFVGEIENGTSQIWQMAKGGVYPVLAAFNGSVPPKLQGTGTAADPYLISNAFELGAMAYYDPSAHYRLAARIDLSGIRWGTAVIPRFGGTFDGSNLTISHLTIKGGCNLGLFGHLASGAEIKNLGVVDVSIIGSLRAGGLVGYNSGTVTQCYITGTVQGNDYVGGLVGFNGGILTNCYSTCTVSASGFFVGGLVGANVEGTVTQSYSTGAVTGGGAVGGLVGANVERTVTQSYSTGAVTGGGAVGGLVGSNWGILTNCYSTGAVDGVSSVGGLVGANEEDSANVYQCYSTGTVSGKDSVGGLVGSNTGGVGVCYSSAAVSGNYFVGGLVGINGNYDPPIGTIAGSYSTGAVSGNSDVGGLVGSNRAEVTNCYSTGAVSGTNRVGGLIGDRLLASGLWGLPRVSACFWDIQTSGQTTSGAGVGKTTAEMQTAKTFLDAGWDFVGETANGTEDIWWIDEGKDYPCLSWERAGKYAGGTGEPNDPYLILTAGQMNAIGAEPNDWGKHFKLMANIDLSGFDGKEGRPTFNVIAPDIDPVKVLFQGTLFTGLFDGNGHTISHLTVKGGESLGLFGRLGSGAQVKKLGVVDVNITGSGDEVGGLAGYSEGGVANCYSSGVVKGRYDVGGLVGWNQHGTLTHCYSRAVLIARSYAGGLVGYNRQGEVTQCYSTGPVSGNDNVGGLVGYNDRDGVVSRSFWDTQTSGQATSAGGTGKTTAEMQTAKTFLDAGWDFVGETANGTADLWWILEGKDYPHLSWELPAGGSE